MGVDFLGVTTGAFLFPVAVVEVEAVCSLRKFFTSCCSGFLLPLTALRRITSCCSLNLLTAGIGASFAAALAVVSFVDVTIGLITSLTILLCLSSRRIRSAGNS